MSKGSGEMRLMPDELKTGDIIEIQTGFWTEITSMQRKITRGVTTATIETSYGEKISLQSGHLYHCWRVGEERREAKLEELGPAYREPKVEPAVVPEPDLRHVEELVPPSISALDMQTHFVGDGCKPAHEGWPFLLKEPDPEEVAYVEPEPEVVDVSALVDPRPEPSMQTHYDKRPPPVMPVTEAERRRYAIDVITDALGHRPHTLDVTVEGEHHVPGFLTLRAEDFILIAATLEDHR